MDDTLKRLLDAEVEAQHRVDEALQERERLVEEARQEARNAERRFNKRIPEIQESFHNKAQERARQTVAEMERHYEERREHLKVVTEQAAGEALEAALGRFMDVQPESQ